MIGFSTSKDTIDSRAGFLALTLRDTFVGIANMVDWLGSTGDAELEAKGYTPVEVALLRAAFTDLAKLGSVARGQDVQADASDFFWNTKHLTGLS